MLEWKLFKKKLKTCHDDKYKIIVTMEVTGLWEPQNHAGILVAIYLNEFRRHFWKLYKCKIVKLGGVPTENEMMNPALI